MRSAYKLLQLLTIQFPPPPRMRHSITLNEEKLQVSLVLGTALFSHFDLDDSDLDGAPEDIVAGILKLMAKK